MQAGAESGPRLRANRSPSIIVNQCICKCLPLRWQTHSFAKLTTFLNSSYLSLQMISPYPRFIFCSICHSLFPKIILLFLIKSLPLSSRGPALFPPCPPSGGPRMPYQPFFGRGGSPNYGESSLSPLPGKYHDFCLISLRSALRRWLRARL